MIEVINYQVPCIVNPFKICRGEGVCDLYPVSASIFANLLAETTLSPAEEIIMLQQEAKDPKNNMRRELIKALRERGMLTSCGGLRKVIATS